MRIRIRPIASVKHFRLLYKLGFSWKLHPAQLLVGVKMDIIVRYSTIDHFSQRRSFKTLDSARKYAFKMVGSGAEISHNFGYAVSSDGVGKITCDGVSIFKLMDREKELQS